jgi:hypothetical protein
MCDMHYTQASSQQAADGTLRMNYKGLLGTNPDQTVSHVKPAYYAAQTVFALFDDTLRRMPDFAFTTTALRGLALTGYQRAGNDAQVVAYWFNDAPPAEANGVTLADVTLKAGRFTEPVLVDMRTSTVYAVPRDRWQQAVGAAVFRSLPVYDSPMLIAEKAALRIDPARR